MRVHGPVCVGTIKACVHICVYTCAWPLGFSNSFSYLECDSYTKTLKNKKEISWKCVCMSLCVCVYLQGSPPVIPLPWLSPRGHLRIIIIIFSTWTLGIPTRAIDLPRVLCYLQLKVPRKQNQLLMLRYSRLVFWKKDNVSTSLKECKGEKARNRDKKTHSLCSLRERITMTLGLCPTGHSQTTPSIP